MIKANLSDVPETRYDSPTGKFCGIDRDLNAAIGGDWRSMDLTKRWPFAVEQTRIPAGKTNIPFHEHSNQYEFYLVTTGTGILRHKDGTTALKPGDFFMAPPGGPHQISADAAGDLTYISVADNPISDHVYYPDSDKFMVRVPEHRILLKGQRLEDYYQGEDEAK